MRPIKHLRLALFFIFLLIITSFLVNFYILKTTPAKAAIATGKDWIGLFAWNAPKYSDWLNLNGHNWATATLAQRIQWANDYMNAYIPRKSATLDDWDGTGWLYTNCKQAGSNTSLLTGHCSPADPDTFKYPNKPGLYQFRLFANDSLYNQDNESSITEPFWIQFTVSVGDSCSSGSTTPIVQLQWPGFAETNPSSPDTEFRVYKIVPPNPATEITTSVLNNNPSGVNSYSDSNVTNNKTYQYYVVAHSKSIPTDPDLQSATVSFETRNCVKPWIKTTNGDVHSNTEIDAPGGY